MVARNGFPLFVQLYADDRLSPVLQRVQQRLLRFGPGLTSTLGLDSIGSRYQVLSSALVDVRTRFLSLATSITAVTVAAGAAGAAILVAFAHTGEELDATAYKIGITTDELQELRYVASSFGVDQGSLDSGLSTFTKRLGQLKLGTGGLLKGLQDLGASGLIPLLGSTKTVGDAFRVFLEQLDQVENLQLRAALADKAFGSSWGALALLLREGIDGFDAQIRHVRAIGGIFSTETIGEMKEMNTLLTDLKLRFRVIGYTAVGLVSPALRKLFDRAAEWIGENREKLLAWAEDFAVRIPGYINSFGETLVELREKMKPLLEDFKEGVRLVGGWGNAFKVAAGILAIPFIASVINATTAVIGLIAALAANPIIFFTGSLVLAAGSIAFFAKSMYDAGLTIEDAWLVIRMAFAAGVDWIEEKVKKLEAALPSWLVPILEGSAGALFPNAANALRFGGAYSTPQREMDLASQFVQRLPAIHDRATARAASGGVSRLIVELVGDVPPNTRVRADPNSDADVEARIGGALAPQ